MSAEFGLSILSSTQISFKKKSATSLTSNGWSGIDVRVAPFNPSDFMAPDRSGALL